MHLRQNVVSQRVSVVGSRPDLMARTKAYFPIYHTIIKHFRVYGQPRGVLRHKFLREQAAYLIKHILHRSFANIEVSVSILFIKF